MKRSCFVDAENVVGGSRIFSRKGVIKFRDLRGRCGRAQADRISPFSPQTRRTYNIVCGNSPSLSSASAQIESRCGKARLSLRRNDGKRRKQPPPKTGKSIYSQKRFRRKDFCEKKKAAPRVAFHIVCVQIVFSQNAHFWVRKAMTSSAFMRTCSMLSLSRTVTVPSSSVVKSMVRQ